MCLIPEEFVWYENIYQLFDLANKGTNFLIYTTESKFYIKDDPYFEWKIMKGILQIIKKK